jgi:hypothetical protein
MFQVLLIHVLLNQSIFKVLINLYNVSANVRNTFKLLSTLSWSSVIDLRPFRKNLRDEIESLSFFYVEYKASAALPASSATFIFALRGWPATRRKGVGLLSPLGGSGAAALRIYLVIFFVIFLMFMSPISLSVLLFSVNCYLIILMLYYFIVIFL